MPGTSCIGGPGTPKSGRCSVSRKVREFEKLADEVLAAMWRWSPVAATAVGIHDHDDELGEFDPASLSAEAAGLRAFEKRLIEGGLPLRTDNDRRLLLAQVRSGLCELEELERWRTNPASYLQVVLYGLLLLIVRRFASPAVRVRSLARRLACVPGVLAQARANVEGPPAVFTSVARQMVEGGIVFLEQGIPAFARSAPSAAREMEAPLEKALGSMHEHADYLSRLERRSTGDFAVGERIFDFKLRNDHFMDLGAADLLKIGEDALSDSEDRLAELAAEISPGKAWTEVVAELKKDHPGAGELLETYRREMERARRFVAETGIVAMPEDEELAVMETPVFDRSTIPYAAYLPPAPFEREQRGLFYVTPVDARAPAERQEEQLQGHCLHSIAVVALHEGYPGHHLQLVTANRAASKVRKVAHNTVFIEGWALYCEELMREQGYYSDKRTVLLQLKDLLWRSARVVIDVKLHRGEFSFEEAVDFLVERAHLEPVNARAEVRRYAMTPTQPMSYLMGKRAIMAIRERFTTGKTGTVELAEFHRRLLSSASAPPAIAESELDGQSEGTG